MINKSLIITLLIPVLLVLTECRSNSEKKITVTNKSTAILGKWRMIENEFECPGSQRNKLFNFNSAVNDTQIVFKFTDSSFQTFYLGEFRAPMPYNFEGDTLTINYPDETPPYVVKSFVEFISYDKIILREPRKETGCILVSSFKRIK